jgi:hypothetical protein
MTYPFAYLYEDRPLDVIQAVARVVRTHRQSPNKLSWMYSTTLAFG